jgi:hypothetical protein
VDATPDWKYSAGSNLVSAKLWVRIIAKLPSSVALTARIGVPQTDQHQTVRVLAVKAPVKTRMTQEPEYGNRMICAEIQNFARGKAEFTLEYKITRREYSRVIMRNSSEQIRSLASCPRR